MCHYVIIWYHCHCALNQSSIGLRNWSRGHPVKLTFLSVKFKRLMNPKISSSSTSSPLSSETSVCYLKRKRDESGYVCLGRGRTPSPLPVLTDSPRLSSPQGRMACRVLRPRPYRPSTMAEPALLRCLSARCPTCYNSEAGAPGGSAG